MKRKNNDLRVGDKIKIINTGIFCGNTHKHLNVITVITEVKNKDTRIEFKCQNGFYGYLHYPDKFSFWNFLELLNQQNNYEIYV